MGGMEILTGSRLIKSASEVQIVPLTLVDVDVLVTTFEDVVEVWVTWRLTVFVFVRVTFGGRTVIVLARRSRTDEQKGVALGSSWRF